MDRPALQQLIELAQAGGIEIVIIEYLDRLSRSLQDTVKLLELLRRHNVELHVLATPELSFSASDNFTINLMASFAEFEREMIRERISESRAALKLKGKRVGGGVPYGYTTRPPSTKLILEPQESRRVKLMFEWAANGKMPIETAQLAKQRRWRTRLHLSVKTGEQLGRKLWTARQVLAVLSNPVYTGSVWLKSGRLVKGEHAAIVSLEVWLRIRKEIQSRKKRLSGDQRFSPSEPLLYKGKVKCSRCGKYLVLNATCSNMNATHSRKYFYYRCRSAGCERVTIQKGKLESAVFHLATLLVGPAEEPMRSAFQEFQSNLKKASPEIKERMLRALVQEIEFDRKTRSLEIKWSFDTISESLRD